MYSIVKDQQNEYMSVEQPDFSTLMKLTDSCKGNRTDTQFERKAALSVSFLTKVRNGKKKRGFSLDEITKIVESQRSSGNVTKDSMIAVNGMVPYDNLVKIVQAIKPEKTDKKDFRRKEFAPPENVHCPYYPDDQKRFLEDITYLSAYLSSDDILFFKENIARIFKDKALVKMIYKFKMHREQEMKNLTAAISTTVTDLIATSAETLDVDISKISSCHCKSIEECEKSCPRYHGCYTIAVANDMLVEMETAANS